MKMFTITQIRINVWLFWYNAKQFSWIFEEIHPIFLHKLSNIYLYWLVGINLYIDRFYLHKFNETIHLIFYSIVNTKMYYTHPNICTYLYPTDQNEMNEKKSNRFLLIQKHKYFMNFSSFGFWCMLRFCVFVVCGMVYRFKTHEKNEKNLYLYFYQLYAENHGFDHIFNQKIITHRTICFQI